MHPVLSARGQYLHDRLMARSADHPNAQPLACMLATQYSGGGAMPPRLGLAVAEFDALLAHYFPTIALPDGEHLPSPAYDPRLVEEKGELVKLLLPHRARAEPGAIWFSQIIATGCMANDHLWHDLGLWSRGMLSELLARNFPTLVARNDRDMKWKKFLYKQLCLQEGVYLCRAPSCAVCSDYSLCFGPES